MGFLKRSFCYKRLRNEIILIRLALFLSLVAIVDVSIGVVFDYLRATKAGGRTGIDYHVCKELDEDILIMGSSRASHHYVPKIFAESL